MSCSVAWNIGGTIGQGRRHRVMTEVELATSEQSTEVIEISPEPSWLSQCLAKLAEFERLAENWDGYNSPPIGQGALASARRFLTTLRVQGLPAPAVLPVNGGGVGLNWVSGPKEVELTILPDGRAEFLHVLHPDLTGDDATEEGVWPEQSFLEKAKEMLEGLIQG